MTNRNRFLMNLPIYFIVIVLLFGGLLISSCNEQARGFALPEGNIEKGKVTFEELVCTECHNIRNIEWIGGEDNLKIQLGGEVESLKTYGDLVTSIINPSHKIASYYNQNTSTEEGLSKMKNYNELMTVQELVDLVAFLQSEYQVVPPPTEYYPYF